MKTLYRSFYLWIILMICGTSCHKAQVVPQTNAAPPDHILIVIMENHSSSEIIGSSQAPYINALISDPATATFTESFAIEHPSQPNYLDLFSGSNQGSSDDGIPVNQPFTTDNLARQLLDAGKTFVTYSEDMPSVGFNGPSSGNYARKHNPVANWMGTGTNQVPASVNQPFTAFPSDYSKLPTVCYVVPNQNNDMHNGSIVLGDTWTKNYLEAYIKWAKTHNSLFILTFDEDDNSLANKILTIFSGAAVKGGTYTDHIDHFTILRTIEDLYGLRHAGMAANAVPITNALGGTAEIETGNAKIRSSISLAANPVNTVAKIHIDQKSFSYATISLVNIFGKQVEQIFSGTMETGEHVFTWNVSHVPSGIYYCTLNEHETQRVPVIVLH